MRQRLILQHRVLDVMPELDYERDGPPFTRRSGKTFAQRPDADEHHDRIAVVQHLGAHEPRIKEAQHAACFWSWPTEHVNLVSLHEMFGPVPEHDEHEEAERALVPNAVQLIVKIKVAGGRYPRVLCGC